MCGLGYHEGRRARQGRGRCALSSPSAMPRATTDHHPATRRGPRRPPPTPARWPTGAMIPRDQDEVLVALGDRRVKLPNLRKLFWPALGITKGDLIRYYVDVAPVLLPHLRDRAMVMRRYPDGAGGKSFFMKRAPMPRPDWLALCAIEHASGNVIDFPMIQDLAALLWVVNLGCIDLNQWYARCDDVDRLGLLGAPDAARRRLDAGHLARGRARARDRRLPPRQRARAHQATRRPVGPAAGGEGAGRSAAVRLALRRSPRALGQFGSRSGRVGVETSRVSATLTGWRIRRLMTAIVVSLVAWVFGSGVVRWHM